jgi:hypothetical protein
VFQSTHGYRIPAPHPGIGPPAAAEQCDLSKGCEMCHDRPHGRVHNAIPMPYSDSLMIFDSSGCSICSRSASHKKRYSLAATMKQRMCSTRLSIFHKSCTNRRVHTLQHGACKPRPMHSPASRGSTIHCGLTQRRVTQTGPLSTNRVRKRSKIRGRRPLRASRRSDGILLNHRHASISARNSTFISSMSLTDMAGSE